MVVSETHSHGSEEVRQCHATMDSIVFVFDNRMLHMKSKKNEHSSERNKGTEEIAYWDDCDGSSEQRLARVDVSVKIRACWPCRWH